MLICVTEQHYVSIFFTRLWSVRKPMLFQFKGSLVTNQQKFHFFFLLPRFIFACRLVLYLYACAVENPEIPGFCVSKNIGLRTDHKRVKKIEMQCCSVVLLHRQALIPTFDIVYSVGPQFLFSKGSNKETKFAYNF